MRPLKYVVITTALASAVIFAQDKNPAGQAGGAGQADRQVQSQPARTQPAQTQPAQTQPAQTQPAQTQPAQPSSAAQADRPSSTAGGAYSRTYTGTIVNADCSQASILNSSGSYADRAPSSSATTATAADQGASSSSKSTTAAANTTSSNKDNKSVYDKQREVLKHCRASDKATAYAVLTDDGSFYKLDEAGNSQVTSLAGSDKEKNKNLKNLRVTVTGTPQGDTLKVQSLTKSDKPFGAA